MNFDATFFKYVIVIELILGTIAIILYFLWARKKTKYKPKKRNIVDDEIEEELKNNKQNSRIHYGCVCSS